MPVDLHIHSTASDGTLAPEEIAEEAARLRLKAIAIADHDELSGVGPAQRRASELGVGFVPAVEINTDYYETEVHILGYWIDPADAGLQEDLARIRDARVQRAQLIVERLQGMGVKLELQDVLEAAGEGSVGRPHIAAALVQAGVCTTLRQAFRKYIGKRCPAYVPRVKPSVQEAIAIIQRRGGCPVLAHPGLVAGRPRIVYEAAELGVEGVEAYHPKHPPGRVAAIVEQAAELGLLVTGGSDSHGPGGADPVPIGAGDIPDSCMEGLRQWYTQRNG
jgi:predicted metal-dependent phosphoesterase TrpH